MIREWVRNEVRLLGELLGEWDDRSGLYHLGGERKGCVYHRMVDCCPLCFPRLVVYEIKLAWEQWSCDPYPDAQTPGVEPEDGDADTWVDGHNVEIPVRGVERNGTGETDGGSE